MGNKTSANVYVKGNNITDAIHSKSDDRYETELYSISIIIWLLIAYFLGLLDGDIVLFIIAMIPVVTFFTFILNKNCAYSAAFPRINSEFLYVILAIFLAWVLVAKKEKEKIIRILLASLAIYVLSLVDFKICNQILFDVTVIVPETMSVALILAALYLYFLSSYSGLGHPGITFL